MTCGSLKSNVIADRELHVMEPLWHRLADSVCPHAVDGFDMQAPPQGAEVEIVGESWSRR